MLGGYLALNGLTDGWAAFYDALRDIKSFGGAGLPDDEQALLSGLVRATEKIVYRDIPPGEDRPRRPHP